MSKLKKRIVLALLLFIIFVPFIDYDNGMRCFTAPCNSTDLGSLIIYIFNGFPHIYGINYPILFGGIILSYLISFLIFRKN